MKNDEGFTLIEVVASIFIIALLLTSFMSLLLSAAKSTQVSKEIIDYTLIAQSEIETIYQVAQDSPKTEHLTVFVDQLGYTVASNQGNTIVYEKSTSQAFISVTLSEYEDSELLNETLSELKVNAISHDNPNRGSQIESVIEWGG